MKWLLVFWSWFPLGPCGIRAVMLFISSLVIFILRVGQMHVGSRTANSAFSRLRGSILSLSSVKILGWYTFSAWIFGEVYIWSSPAQAGFNWVKPGRSVTTSIDNICGTNFATLIDLPKEPNLTNARFISIVIILC